MIERTIDIPTKDGATTTFVVHPERSGPHPVIVFYMDAPAIREELRDMARRFASAGYYVLLPNLYYRSGVMEIGPLSRDPNDPGRKRMFELMESLSIPKIMEDTRGLLKFVDEDPAAKKTKMGAVGYCMSGQYAINAAAQFPDRFTAAASIYGVRLVTEAADSPHKMAGKIKGESYFACAEIDSWAPKEMVDDLRKAVDGLNTEVEWCLGVEHGFAFPQRPAYNKDAAERHWERLYALFARNLTMFAIDEKAPARTDAEYYGFFMSGLYGVIDDAELSGYDGQGIERLRQARDIFAAERKRRQPES